MAFLLFLVSLIFSISFYILGFLSWPRETLGGFFGFDSSWFFSLFFLLLGVGWFSYFYFIVRGHDQRDGSPKIDYKKAKEVFARFLQTNLYYIGFIFLYTALYFIIGPLVGYDFSYLIFIISFLILVLFFLSEKFSLFRDLIKINTILFSLYYIVLFLYSLAWGSYVFSLIDLINQVFILSFFVLNIYNDKILLGKKTSDNALIGYGLSYGLLFLIFYISKLGLSPLLSTTYVGLTLSLFIKHIGIDFHFFHGNRYILKSLALIFGYVALLSGITYFTIYGFQFVLLLALIYLIYDNFLTHIKYQNYVSLLLGLFASFFLYMYFYTSTLFSYELGGYIFLCYSYLFYFGGILSGYAYKFTYDYDYYMVYIPLYIGTIISSLYFLFTYKFELFNFGVILLFEAIATFLIYYKFNTLKKHDQDHLSERL